jgi:hypothetical protein
MITKNYLLDRFLAYEGIQSRCPLSHLSKQHRQLLFMSNVAKCLCEDPNFNWFVHNSTLDYQ